MSVFLPLPATKLNLNAECGYTTRTFSRYVDVQPSLTYSSVMFLMYKQEKPIKGRIPNYRNHFTLYTNESTIVVCRTETTLNFQDNDAIILYDTIVPDKALENRLRNKVGNWSVSFDKISYSNESPKLYDFTMQCSGEWWYFDRGIILNGTSFIIDDPDNEPPPVRTDKYADDRLVDNYDVNPCCKPEGVVVPTLIYYEKHVDHFVQRPLPQHYNNLPPHITVVHSTQAPSKTLKAIYDEDQEAKRKRTEQQQRLTSMRSSSPPPPPLYPRRTRFTTPPRRSGSVASSHYENVDDTRSHRSTEDNESDEDRQSVHSALSRNEELPTARTPPPVPVPQREHHSRSDGNHDILDFRRHIQNGFTAADLETTYTRNQTAAQYDPQNVLTTMPLYANGQHSVLPLPALTGSLPSSLMPQLNAVAVPKILGNDNVQVPYLRTTSVIPSLYWFSVRQKELLDGNLKYFIPKDGACFRFGGTQDRALKRQWFQRQSYELPYLGLWGFLLHTKNVNLAKKSSTLIQTFDFLILVLAPWGTSSKLAKIFWRIHPELLPNFFSRETGAHVQNGHQTELLPNFFG